MAEKIKTLQDIYKMLAADPPHFLRSAFESFVSLFLVALIIFFCILLLQISKNLVFKKGKHLLSQGACCIALSLVLALVFSPAPCNAVKENGFKRVELVQLSGKEKTASRYFFIFEQQKLNNIIIGCTQTLSIAPRKAAKKDEVNYKLNITYKSGSEEEIYVSKSGAYYTAMPKSGFVRRYVEGQDKLFSFLQDIKFEGA